MYLAHRKLSNGYNPLFAKHPATDPLIECTCYIWERDCIFSHYHDKKKRHEHLSSPFLVLRLPIRNSSLVFIQSSPFLILRLPIPNSSLVFNLSTKRNKSTITSFELYNFSKKRNKKKNRRTSSSPIFDPWNDEGGMAIRGARVPRIKSARSRQTAAFRSEHRSRARLIAARVGDYARGTVG